MLANHEPRLVFWIVFVCVCGVFQTIKTPTFVGWTSHKNSNSLGCSTGPQAICTSRKHRCLKPARWDSHGSSRSGVMWTNRGPKTQRTSIFPYIIQKHPGRLIWNLQPSPISSPASKKNPLYITHDLFKDHSSTNFTTISKCQIYLINHFSP